MEDKIFRYNFKFEWIEALLRGQRLCLRDDENIIEFYPPNAGVFLSDEEYRNLLRRVSTDLVEVTEEKYPHVDNFLEGLLERIEVESLFNRVKKMSRAKKQKLKQLIEEETA